MCRFQPSWQQYSSSSARRQGVKVSKNAAKESEVYVFALWAGYTGLTKTWKNTAKANLFLVENTHRDVGKAYSSCAVQFSQVKYTAESHHHHVNVTARWP